MQSSPYLTERMGFVAPRLALAFILLACCVAVIFFAGKTPLGNILIQFFLSVGIFSAFVFAGQRLDLFLELLRPVRLYLFLICTYIFFVFWQSFFGSIYSLHTQAAAVQLVYYFFIYLACVPLLQSRRRVEGLVFSLAIITFIISVSGMIQKLAGPETKLFWAYFEPDDARLFGPFLSENDFGGFLAVVFPWLLAVFHYRLESFQRESKHGAWHQFLIGRGNFLSLFVLGLSFTACFFAMARSALLIILLSVVVYSLSWFWIHKKAKIGYWVVVVVFLSAGALSYLADSESFRQFEWNKLIESLQTRWGVWLESLEIWKQFPILGCGVGTYSLISASVLSLNGAQLRAYHADNHYVELLIESGIIGALIFIVAMGGLVWRLVFCSQPTQSLWKRIMRFQATIALLNIVLLELFSFHLRTPLIAMVFVFQLALLTAQHHSTQSLQVALSSKKIHAWHRQSLVAIMMICLFGLSWFTFNRSRVWAIVQFSPLMVGVESALKIQPHDAELWHRLAKEQEAYFDQVGEKIFLDKAIGSIQQAQKHAPAYGYYWFYGGVLLDKKGLSDEAVLFLKKGIEKSPHYYHYHFYLLNLAMRKVFYAQDPEVARAWFIEAKTAYQRMMTLKTPPLEWRLRAGLGPEGYRALQFLLKYWRMEPVAPQLKSNRGKEYLSGSIPNSR